MNREHLKSGIALACAAIPILAAIVLWMLPGPQDQEGITTQAAAVLQSILVLLGFRFVRSTSLPDGLALGYFWSFVEPLANSLPHRQEIALGGKAIEPATLRFEIWIPESLEPTATHEGLAALRARLAELPEEPLDTGEHGLRTVRVHRSGENVTIVDVPRALDVLERTLTRELGAASEAKRRKIADRELDEFATRLARSLDEQRGAFFRDKVRVRRPTDEGPQSPLTSA